MRRGPGCRDRPGRRARRWGARSSGRPPRAAGSRRGSGSGWSPSATTAASVPARARRAPPGATSTVPRRSGDSPPSGRPVRGAPTATASASRPRTTTTSSRSAASTCSTAARTRGRPSASGSVSFCRPIRVDAPGGEDDRCDHAAPRIREPDPSRHLTRPPIAPAAAALGDDVPDDRAEHDGPADDARPSVGTSPKASHTQTGARGVSRAR